jgi:hypothetical protein
MGMFVVRFESGFSFEFQGLEYGVSSVNQLLIHASYVDFAMFDRRVIVCNDWCDHISFDMLI